MKFSNTTKLLLVSSFFSLAIQYPSDAATCTASQLSTIRMYENQLASKQANLSREQANLMKINQKINGLQQSVNRYSNMKNMQSLASSYQRQLDSALRDQGYAMQKVSSAQTFYDMASRSYTSAVSRCTR